MADYAEAFGRAYAAKQARRIAELEERLATQSQRMDQLSATNATLLKELAEKDARIAELEAELAGLVAVRVSSHAMNDNHTFRPLTSSTVQGLVQEWKDYSESNATFGPSLCPVILVDKDGETVRRVGEMVHRTSDLGGIERFVETLEADSEVVRILAERDHQQEGEQS